MLWKETWGIYDDQGNKTPPPTIDFSHHMVIAAFWGEGFNRNRKQDKYPMLGGLFMMPGNYF